MKRNQRNRNMEVNQELEHRSDNANKNKQLLVSGKQTKASIRAALVAAISEAQASAVDEIRVNVERDSNAHRLVM
ncbi:hypothetical protein [Vibrio methylphosphonaticus]|uniref:hypothetical protein n=1 Tax=Vibrio methylphosphonaticus TaxID=2946866 RepID=UPI00202A86A4|nr:hypothetical protein [Vibrio methylphosphonaticus]MCL9777585.1 hypothetical protein [Vibrio methylphosphonaticus]